MPDQPAAESQQIPDYAAYLESRHWVLYRRAKLAKAVMPKLDNELHPLLVKMLDGEIPFLFWVPCEDCNNEYPRWFTHVHHLTYERLGRERLCDTVVLCAACHAKRHGLTPPIFEELAP